MIPVKNKLRVCHHAQVPCKAFTVEVPNEQIAKLMIDALGNQHLFLFKHKIIPDYSNVIYVEMFDEDGKEWSDYWNEEECMEWDEFEQTYL